MSERPEEDRVAGRTIARVALVIFAVLAGSLALLGALAYYYTRSHPGNPANWPIPAAPRIQPDLHAELEAYLAQQRARLGGYRWVDPARGLVHLPIERAMQLYASEANRGGAQ